MWLAYALASAIFAALTSIFAKLGLASVNSNLATAIRTAVVLIMSCGIILATGGHREVSSIDARGWLFLALSGVATGASWLFYMKALEIGEASKVIPVDKLSVVFSIMLAFAFLNERFTAKSAIGIALLASGTLFLVL